MNSLDWMPEFFIVGAMKCGTTTLHRILDQHPAVFLPRGEMFFFDIDDFEQHADFFPYENARWHDRDFDAELPVLLNWYQAFFAAAKPGQMRGEDSTTYLASVKAPTRIARLKPAAKILVMLRDPAERSYSEYWHLVRHGRAFLDFEDTLRYWPNLLVQRSFYLRQLQRYLDVFPREQLMIILLEDLIRSPAEVVTKVCAFLGVGGDLSPAALSQHSNAGGAPRSLTLALMRNRLLWRDDARFMLPRMPGGSPAVPSFLRKSMTRSLDVLHRRINASVRKIPPMRPETRRFLDGYFARENAGLDDLLGVNLDRYWYRSRRDA